MRALLADRETATAAPIFTGVSDCEFTDPEVL
jgi:hypothetical protein